MTDQSPLEILPPTKVIAAPLADVDVGRVDMEIPAGLTIREIVDIVLPGAADVEDRFRVVLVTREGMTVVANRNWHRIRPRPGVQVVIRSIPGKSALRSILQIVVSIAAVALGQVWGAALAGSLFGGAGAGLITAGLTIGLNALGSLLINALIPPVKPSTDDDTPFYTITSFRNELRPEGAVPLVCGKIRYSPPFAAPPYTEIVGDWQYIRAIFLVGHGPVAISDLRLGDTPLSKYGDASWQVYQGYASDPRQTIYPAQVYEEQVGAELTRPLPRDAKGNIISGAAQSTPVQRSSGSDAAEGCIIFGFPGGLIAYNDSGESYSVTVEFRIRQRLAGTTDWTVVTQLALSGKTREAIYRSHRWTFPARGKYEIEVERLTAEHSDSKVQSRSVWVAVQSFRPEYPLNFPFPVAIVALRLRATHQLNGALDNFNCLCEAVGTDYDVTTGAWTWRKSTSPAAAHMRLLTGTANPRPTNNAGIDMTMMVDWHNFCREKGLEFNRVFEQTETRLSDLLAEICHAGRASPRHDGVRRSVVIDRPSSQVIDHVNPRNAYDFQAERAYFEPPHAFRIKFNDETNEYEAAERIVPWPGYTGDITLIEQLDLPGKTNPDEIFREGRRRQLELIYRLDTYRATQDATIRSATRGDLLMWQTDILEHVHIAARVKAVEDHLIELDEEVDMEAGVTYGLRYRRDVTAANPLGYSEVIKLVTIAGTHRTVIAATDTYLPAAGDIVQIGLYGQEAIPVRLRAIESGNNVSILHAVDDAPEIDEEIDALVIPAWDGRAGGEIGQDLSTPSAPVIATVASGISGTGIANALEVTLRPAGITPLRTFVVYHRVNGASEWSSTEVPAADGGVQLIEYAAGQTIQIQAGCISLAGVASAARSAIVTETIGANDSAVPGALDAESIQIAGGLGSATVTITTPGSDTSTVAVRIYRSTSATVNTGTDRVGEVEVQAGIMRQVIFGDATRSNLLASGDFASSAGWTLGTGWSIASGLATHVGPTAGDLSQAITVSTGQTVRVSFRIREISAGSAGVRLTGGTVVTGPSRSTLGVHLASLVAVAGSNAVALTASSDFAGSIDDAQAYIRTASCLDQGTHYWWLCGINDQGAAGPLVGPFVTTVL